MATEANQFQVRIAQNIEAVIPIGQTDSGNIDTVGCTIVALRIPPAITGTSFSYEVTNDLDEGFVPYYNADGDVVSHSVGADRAIGFIATDFAPFRYLRIVSNAAEAAERTIQVITRSL